MSVNVVSAWCNPLKPYRTQWNIHDSSPFYPDTYRHTVYIYVYFTHEFNWVSNGHFFCSRNCLFAYFCHHVSLYTCVKQLPVKRCFPEVALGRHPGDEPGHNVVRVAAWRLSGGVCHAAESRQLRLSRWSRLTALTWTRAHTSPVCFLEERPADPRKTFFCMTAPSSDVCQMLIVSALCLLSPHLNSNKVEFTFWSHSSYEIHR